MMGDALTNLLAERVMGWKVCPDRYLKSGRNWIPKWRFDPMTRLEDAFLLLDALGGTYKLTFDSDEVFTAFVEVGGRTGVAFGLMKARTITLAVAHVLGVRAGPK